MINVRPEQAILTLGTTSAAVKVVRFKSLHLLFYLFSICDKPYWYSYCMCYLRFLYAAPSQQPAPLGFAFSYSSIKLSWHPPDSPNSNRLSYTLIRDGHSVHNIQSSYPFSTCTHTHFKQFNIMFLLKQQLHLEMLVFVSSVLRS